MERRETHPPRGVRPENRGAEIVLTTSGASAFGAPCPHLRAVRELFIDALTPTNSLSPASWQLPAVEPATTGTAHGAINSARK
jgi:hypothetical protein